MYDQFSAETTKLGDQKYALIKQYAQNFGSLTDEQAKNRINRSLALDEAAAQLRIKYVPTINRVLPSTKTATFFQMERRVSTLIDLQLASQIPLVQTSARFDPQEVKKETLKGPARKPRVACGASNFWRVATFVESCGIGDNIRGERSRIPKQKTYQGLKEYLAVTCYTGNLFTPGHVPSESS
jgi:hypothetical protein